MNRYGVVYIKRISKVLVKGLLDQYNYAFNLSLESRITMIFAPNGSGKTKLLKLINALFKNDFEEMYEIPFSEIHISFMDNCLLKVMKVLNDEESEEKNYFLYEFKDKEVFTKFKVGVVTELPPLNSITRRLPFLRRIGPKEWFDTIYNRRLGLNEILTEYESIFNINYILDDQYKEMIKSFLNIHYIETNRLHDKRISSYEMRRHSYGNEAYYDEDESYTVNLISEEIKRLISNKLNEFASVSQKLDSTFPTRLVSQMKNGKKSIDVNSIYVKLEELDAYRRKLAKIGLIDNQEDSFKSLTENLDEYIANVLALYIKDTEEKFQIFEDLERRITLFLDILNSRYKDKELQINKNDGLNIKLKNGRYLKNINQLSSGEQHTLVLNYNLLFESRPNTLVLIDEPEISLHMEWQQSFLDDLIKITKLTNLDFIVATHSPDIMNGNFEICVGLDHMESY
ncbi:AAA family ATPase [Bacillus sp. AFS029533]|uniref:AAA family ATPase n=1 Tax=Bacillus sp. AFS029533 TaxID=2033494 RepID=UPI0015D4B49F|nr:AAA family ATPase [Bacillus sp. AFS029533]